MEVNCIRCRNRIESEHINVQKDTALCVTCDHLFALSDLLSTKKNPNFDSRTPVPGIRYVERGNTWFVEASHRSFQALFLVPFTFVWAWISLSGIYGWQIASGEFDLSTSLFGLPFLIGSIFLTGLTLMNLFGKTLVSVENSKALVFIGIGPVGWYRRIDWRDVSAVVENVGRQYRSISLEGPVRTTFGWGLSEERTYYLLNVLRGKLA